MGPVVVNATGGASVTSDRLNLADRRTQMEPANHKQRGRVLESAVLRCNASNRAKFNESLPVGRNEQLLSASDLHFAEDFSEMSANSRFFDAQPFRDLLVL